MTDRMTLSDFAERVRGMLWADGWHDLDEIADRLEEELAELDRMRCADEVYRVNNEDYTAALWVREHGGLAQVEMDYAMGDGFTDLADEVARRLGLCIDGLDAQDSMPLLMDALDRRLMPEGMEWPRYESGEPVRPGDRLLDKNGDWFEAVSFVFTCDWWSVRGYQTEGFGDLNNETRRKLEGMAYGTCVKRHAPKVLDADGAEIRVGDTVCGTRDMEPMRVVDTDSRECGFKRIKCEKEGEGFFFYCADELTHKLTILAADGKPLREGETVWDVESGIEYEVVGIHTDEDTPVRVMRTDGSHLAKAAKPSTLTHQRPVLDADGVPIKKGDTVWRIEDGREFEVTGVDAWFSIRVRDESMEIGVWTTPCGFTHTKPEPPDSWERIESDCSKFCIEYCDEHGLLDHGCNAAEGDASTRHCTDCGDSCEERMARDLVRRCKALAERGA